MRIVMMGTGTFAEPTFEALLAGSHPVVALVTQPDRAAGEVRGSTRQTGRGIRAIAQEHGIPVAQPENINTPEGITALRGFRPDLLVVAAYGQILARDVLAIPPQGGINVHASLLPKYRGAAPVAWAIYHGETITGVTIIHMSVHLDAGEMLAQEEVPIQPEETAGELETRLAPVGARLAVRVVGQIANGTAVGIKQDRALVTKAPKLTKDQGLIDWTRSAGQVCNQIRAMQPWPTAYTYLNHTGQPPLRVLIARAACLDATNADDIPPGQVVPSEDHARLIVSAGGRGRLEVVELQPAGKRRMPAAEFLRGHRLRPGDRFGPETA
jgi:methionyl-tRNA formyltransferase